MWLVTLRITCLLNEACFFLQVAMHYIAPSIENSDQIDLHVLHSACGGGRWILICSSLFLYLGQKRSNLEMHRCIRCVRYIWYTANILALKCIYQTKKTQSGGRGVVCKSRCWWQVLSSSWMWDEHIVFSYYLLGHFALGTLLETWRKESVIETTLNKHYVENTKSENVEFGTSVKIAPYLDFNCLV